MEDKYKSTLDLYYEALNKGIIDIDGQKSKEAQREIEHIENKIDSLNKTVDESNLKIKSWQTLKVTASKEGKAELNRLISSEREYIAVIKQQIKEEKALKTAVKDRANEYVEAHELINDGLKLAGKSLDDESKRVSLAFKLWTKDSEKNMGVLEKLCENQAQKVLSVVSAYGKMAELYGVNHEESKKLETQILAECNAYEKTLETLKRDSFGYTREEINDIVYSLNDYIKQNYKLLSDAGFSDEQIYASAKGYSGYDNLEQNYQSLKAPTKAQQEVELLIEGLNEKFTDVSKNFALGISTSLEDFAKTVQSVFESIVNSASSSISSSVITNVSGSTTYNTNYNSTYHLNPSSVSSVADEIAEIKNYDAIKKARGY